MSRSPHALLERAFTHAARAVALLPGNAAALALLGRLHLLRGEASAAKAPLDESLRIDPLAGTAFLAALCRYEIGERESARALSEAAIEDNEVFGRARILHGACLVESGDFAEAIEDFRVAASDGRHAGLARLWLAGLLLAQAHAKGAAADDRHLEEALGLLGGIDPAVGTRARSAFEVFAHVARGDGAAALRAFIPGAYERATVGALWHGLALLCDRKFEDAALYFVEAHGDRALAEDAKRFGSLATSKTPMARGTAGLPAPGLDLLPRIGTGTLLAPLLPAEGTAPRGSAGGDSPFEEGAES